MALKAQQEPQFCWFFISVTLPKVLQSNDEGDRNKAEELRDGEDRGKFNDCGR